MASVSLLILITGFVNYSKPLYTNIPTNAFGTGNVINATRFSNWIGGVTPVVNVFVKPADGINFVGDNIEDISTFDRQDFLRWSQQMFYWLLSPVPSDGSYGSCNGLVMNSPAFFDVTGNTYVRHKCDVFSKNNMSFDVKSTQNGKHNLPLFFEHDTEKVYDIEKTPKSRNGFQLVLDDKGNKIEISKIVVKENHPVFYDRQGKIIKKVTLIFGEKLSLKTTMQQFVFKNKIYNIALASKFSPIIIFPTVAQASLNGNTSNVLMARNGSLVYYNIMVNDVYAVFTQMVNNGTLPFESKFPTTIEELIEIKDYAATNGIPIIDTDDRVLAMELKTSWVEVTNLTNPNDYVKTTATIPNYVQTSPGAWTRSGTRSTTLALVGIHVVGSVLGHPEMIWSTFEHINNTPNSSYTFKNTTGAISTSATDDTSTDFLFSRPKTATYTPTFNVPRITGSWNLTGANGFTISNSDTRRNIPFGWGGQIPVGGNPGNNPVDIMNIEESNAQLVAINTDGKNRLVGTDVRKKYFQVGSTWSSKFVDNQQAGTIRMSNSTMETYTQATTGNINSISGAGLNCFSCHDAGFGTIGPNGFEIPGPNEKFLSHVFGYNIIP